MIILCVGSGLATGWSPSKESYRLCKKDQETDKAAKAQERAVEPSIDGWMDGWTDGHGVGSQMLLCFVVTAMITSHPYIRRASFKTALQPVLSVLLNSVKWMNRESPWHRGVGANESSGHAPNRHAPFSSEKRRRLESSWNAFRCLARFSERPVRVRDLMILLLAPSVFAQAGQL
jgi:hypothetical protein